MEAVTLDLPGCKSASQRALILAALAEGTSSLRGLSNGDDTQFLLAALRDLGWVIDCKDAQVCKMQGRRGPQLSEVSSVSIGEGGSTLRFLAPLLAAVEQGVDLLVAPGLRQRPQRPMVEVLQHFGATLSPTSDGFHLNSHAAIPPTTIIMPVDLSSQFFSGFLMASGCRAQTWQLTQAPVSRGYLDMTIAMLRRFRGDSILHIQEDLWHQAAGFGVGQDLTIPSDASAVVFFAVAAVLQQRTINIRQSWDPHHPDVAVLDFLEALGLLQVEGSCLIGTGAESMQAIPQTPVFDLQQSPDSGPALAVLASNIPCGMTFLNPQRLRFKESDRIAGMQQLASICGASMASRPESLMIVPGDRPRSQVAFDPQGDHRLAMAAGVAACGYPGAEIQNQECVAKSFPDFWNQLYRLR